MKKILKKIWRKYFLTTYLKIKNRNIFLNHKNINNVFSEIYKTNYWSSDESKSGKGSSVKNTRYILTEIKKVISEYNIKTFLDVPCGDCNRIDPENLGCSYLGGDIVIDLIKTNKEKFPNINFQKIDITADYIPKVDVIFCRECLQHLSYENIFKALENFQKSGSKYLLTTTYLNGINKNILNGMYFEINLEKEPFNFPKPLLKIEEKNNNIFYNTNNLEYLYMYELSALKNTL